MIVHGFLEIGEAMAVSTKDRNQDVASELSSVIENLPTRRLDSPSCFLNSAHLPSNETTYFSGVTTAPMDPAGICKYGASCFAIGRQLAGFGSQLNNEWKRPTIVIRLTK